MKVLEIKNNLVKISYDASEHLVLSGFVIIEDENMPYVAQIVNLKADENGNFAIVKLIFTFNAEGIVTNYDGSIPSLHAIVTPLPAAELLDILPVNNPLKLVMLAQQPFMLNLDQTLLKKDLVICSDNNESTSTIVNNFVKQAQRIAQKSVVCDVNDSIAHEDKFIFGEDFKLPLNYNTINFIWENDLDDVDAKSRAVIQDIFLEVQEYAKTASHEFIPFDSFISVVDAQYQETKITELVLLKNKLLKYKENKVFANHHSEFKNLKGFIEKNSTTVIDLSTIFNPKLQKQVIEFVYDVMHSVHETIYAFTLVNNSNSDKKLIKRFYSSGSVFTTVVCNHDYKYLTELKQISRNLIMFAPQTVQHDFASYNTFLSKLNHDEFVIYGELTQSIPLIVQLMQIETLDTLERKLQEERRLEEQKQAEFERAQMELKEASKPVTEEVPQTTNIFEQEVLQSDFNNEITDNAAQTVDEYFIYNDEKEPEIPTIDEVLEREEAMLNQETVEVEPLDFGTPEIVEEPVEYAVDELSQTNTYEEPIEETITDEFNEPLGEEFPQEEFVEEEPVTEEPVENVMEEPHYIGINDEVEEVNEEAVPQDDLTDDDLNFIEEIQSEDNIETEPLPTEDSEFEELEDLGLEDELEEIPASSETPSAYEMVEEEPPAVPIYPADDINIVEGEQTLEQGDKVSHPKYGIGVVEKMIKYGNKTLCSINFENVGRRLLDPAISEITKG